VKSNGVIPLTKSNRIKGRKGDNNESEKRAGKSSVNGARRWRVLQKELWLQSPIVLSATSL